MSRPKKMTKTELKKTLEPSIEKLRFIQKISQETLRLNNVIDHLQADIANLNHQIIGYKAVISYLENQLGLKASQ